MIRIPGFGRPRESKPATEEREPPEVAETFEAAGLDTAPIPADGVIDEEPEAPAEEEAAAPARVGGLEAPDPEEQIRMVEAMLFAASGPLSVTELSERMPVGSDAAHAVRELEARYATRGVQLVRVAGKWAFRTAPDLAFLMRGEVIEQRKLSKAAVETLAVIAYHQPVTRTEIEEIRQVGVSKGTVDLLMELDWVKLGRRRQTPGRPVTFVTTDHFLQKFGLDSLRDLPGLDELRQAGLLDRRPPGLGASTATDAAEADDDAAAEAAEIDALGADETEAERVRRQDEMTL